MDAAQAFESHLSRHFDSPREEDVTYDIRCDPSASVGFYASNISHGPNGYVRNQYSLEDSIADRDRAIEKARIACAILGEEMLVYEQRRWGDEDTGGMEETCIAHIVWDEDEQKVMEA